MSTERQFSDLSLPPSAPVVGRLAPSPTGGLHLGNARTFLVAWLMARKANGRMIFRMEDLDAGRARADAADAAIEDLRWLGLDWDEGPDIGGPHGPYDQSRRTDHYRRALERLIEADLVYACTCTRAEIVRMASAPHAEDQPTAYPGTCAVRHADEAKRLTEQGRSFAWRFRTAGTTIEWQDEVLGFRSHALESIGGDFIVARSGGAWSYQLAVVVDDAAMGVTQVVRGRDLADSTPRQIMIQEALSLPRPKYFHLGLVLGLDGKRLAKRDQAVKIGHYREIGMSPESLLGILARSLGIETESATPSQLLATAWSIENRILSEDRTIAFGDRLDPRRQ
jgi:glutamyl-tRNA synthetase